MVNEMISEVKVCQKMTLSIKEAAALSGIGENKIRFLADKYDELTIHIGNHVRIKRKKLEELIMKLDYL